MRDQPRQWPSQSRHSARRRWTRSAARSTTPPAADAFGHQSVSSDERRQVTARMRRRQPMVPLSVQIVVTPPILLCLAIRSSSRRTFRHGGWGHEIVLQDRCFSVLGLSRMWGTQRHKCNRGGVVLVPNPWVATKRGGCGSLPRVSSWSTDGHHGDSSVRPSFHVRRARRTMCASLICRSGGSRRASGPRARRV
jgi:hypothetical protein